MRASDILIWEHRIIQKVLEILDLSIQKLLEGQKVDGKTLEALVDFIKNYADKSHHGKEETVLFSFLRSRKLLKDAAIVSVIEREHEQGRELVKALTEVLRRYSKGEEAAKTDIVDNAVKYVMLLRRHIFEEDNVLLPMVDNILSREDQTLLLEEFKKVEKREYEKGVYDKYQRVLEVLEIHASVKFQNLSRNLDKKINSFYKD